VHVDGAQGGEPSEATKRFSKQLADEVERSHRQGVPLALVFLAVDVPGTSRPVPDALTDTLALMSRAVVREDDLVVPLRAGRLAVVVNAPPGDAARLARVLAGELETFHFTCAGREFDLRVRYGLASLGDGMGPSELLKAAIEALGSGQGEKAALGQS